MARPAESLSRPVTADELLRMPDDGLRRELVRGELRTMTPAGHHHGRLAANLMTPLGQFVREKRLGSVYTAETGFLISSSPDTVRAPDCAFVHADRVAQVGDSEGFWPGAPDLAAEVLSPSDTFSEVEEKVFDWLAAGARMVIVVNPKSRTVTVYRSRTEITLLTDADVLDGADVVPGWRLPVREIFD